MEPETISQIDNELKKIQERADELNAKKDALSSLTPLERLAISMFRTSAVAKMDSDWYYHYKDGVPTWKSELQQRYIRKASQLVTAIERTHTPNTDGSHITLCNDLAVYFDDFNR